MTKLSYTVKPLNWIEAAGCYGGEAIKATTPLGIFLIDFEEEIIYLLSGTDVDPFYATFLWRESRENNSFQLFPDMEKAKLLCKQFYEDKISKLIEEFIIIN